MKENLLIAAVFCAIAGFIMLWAVRKYRIVLESSQRENSMVKEAPAADSNSARSINGKKSFSFSYWGRLLLAGCFFVESGLLTTGAFFLEQETHRIAFYCVLAAVGLVVWQVIWAMIDAVGNYVFLSQKNAMEIIQEEKELLKKHLEGKIREEELSRTHSSAKENK